VSARARASDATTHPAGTATGGSGRHPAASAGEQAYRRSTELSTSPEPALLAHQIMSSPVVTTSPDVAGHDAARLMHERGFHHLPVVSSSGELLGMVSDRDLLPAAATDRVIGEIMADRVLTASPEATIRQVARVMMEECVGSIPLLDERHRIAGILTRSDVLRCIVNHAPVDLWVR